MEHLFVPLDIALLAKQHGFKDECCTYFLNGGLQRLGGFGITNDLFDDDDDDSRIAAPIYQQLIDWFIEKHNLHITLKHRPHNQQYGFVISGKWDDKIRGIIINDFFSRLTRKEALNKAIEETFKLIK